MLIFLALTAMPCLYYLFRRISYRAAWIAAIAVVLPWIVTATLLLGLDFIGWRHGLAMDQGDVAQLLDPLASAIIDVLAIGLGTQAYLHDQALKNAPPRTPAL